MDKNNDILDFFSRVSFIFITKDINKRKIKLKKFRSSKRTIVLFLKEKQLGQQTSQQKELTNQIHVLFLSLYSQI